MLKIVDKRSRTSWSKKKYKKGFDFTEITKILSLKFRKNVPPSPGR